MTNDKVADEKCDKKRRRWKEVGLHFYVKVIKVKIFLYTMWSNHKTFFGLFP